MKYTYACSGGPNIARFRAVIPRKACEAGSSGRYASVSTMRPISVSPSITRTSSFPTSARASPTVSCGRSSRRRRRRLGGGGRARGEFGVGAGLEFVRFNRFRAFDARQREAVQDAARFYVGHRERRRNGAPGVEVFDDELVADAQAHPGESLAAQVGADRRDRRISDFPTFERRERGEAEGDFGDRATFAG